MIKLLFCSLLICVSLYAKVSSQSFGKSDIVTGSLRTIEAEHAEVHAGNHYIACGYDADVDAAKYWRFTAPDTSVRIHVTGFIVSSVNGVLELYENPTISAAGTPSPLVFNNDRNSTNTTGLVLAEDATTSDDGSRLFITTIGSDGVNPVGAQGGAGGRNVEFVLKQGEDYIAKYTPEGTNNRVSVCLNFYEE